MARKEPVSIPLAAEHIAQMDRDAPAALARRNRPFYTDYIVSRAELSLVAVVSLAGLWIWETPPIAMLVLLLASVWLGIVGDWVKALLLRDAVRREEEVASTDGFVWAVAGAMVLGRTEVPRLGVAPPDGPGLALKADVVFCGFMTAMLLLVASNPANQFGSLLALDRDVLLMLVAMLFVQVASHVWLVLRHRDARGEHARTGFAAGTRGLLLFFVVFFVLALGNGGDARPGLTLINIALLLLNLLWVFNYRFMRREYEWLRARLADRGAQEERPVAA